MNVMAIIMFGSGIILQVIGFANRDSFPEGFFVFLSGAILSSIGLFKNR